MMYYIPCMVNPGQSVSHSSSGCATGCLQSSGIFCSLLWMNDKLNHAEPSWLAYQMYSIVLAKISVFHKITTRSILVKTRLRRNQLIKSLSFGQNWKWTNVPFALSVFSHAWTCLVPGFPCVVLDLWNQCSNVANKKGKLIASDKSPARPVHFVCVCVNQHVLLYEQNC